ncbi:MAG: hypothetical protein K2H56_04245 [Malacoplasma sp.]|nr:hypothetical protein [Malacoplasma sp.]
MKNILNLKTLSIAKDKEVEVTGIERIAKSIEKLSGAEKSKLKLNINNISTEFDYNGLKVVVCDDPNLMIRELLNNNESNSKIQIGDTLVKSKNLFHFHHFSKVSDFINTRNNSIFHEYLKNKDIHKINLEFQDFVASKYYSLDDKNIEDISSIDFEKASVLNYIEISDEYVNKNNIINILNIIKAGTNEKQTILINDYKVLTITEIVNNYLDDFNFIIFTNDLRKWVNDFTYAECLLIINDFINEEFKIDALEVLDKNILVKYIEKRFKNQKSENKSFIEKFIE